MDKERLNAEIQSCEGFRPYCYPDSEGYMTIGIGRLCDKRKIGSGLSKDEAFYLLNNDIDKCIAELDRRLPWWRKLSDGRQRAIVNMAFQLGVDGLLKFRNSLVALIDALTTENYNRAADMFLQSEWAKQTPERAKFVTDLIRKG